MRTQILAFLLSIPQFAQAAPYFRPLDIRHPHTSAGAYIAVDDPAQSFAGTTLALITHSPKDGTIFPNFPVDWTPLAIGFGVKSGGYMLGIGPSLNLEPVVRGALYQGLITVTDKEKYLGLKSILAPVVSPSDVSISFGPAWVVAPLENWKGYFRIQAGACWKY